MTTETTETTTEATEAPPPEAELAPPADPPPAETPEQAAAREQKQVRDGRIERATRAEQAAAEGREMRRAYRAREQAATERRQLDAERRAWEEKQAAEAEAIRKGGVGALRARTGLDYSTLTKEWIDESSPEGRERAQFARDMAEHKRALAELTQQQQAQRIEAAFTAITSTLEHNAEKFPHVYEMTSGEFRAAVPAIAQRLIAQGRQPTESLVLKTLDDIAKDVHAERENRRAALQTRIKSKPSNGATQQSSSSNASRAVRTLTSQDGSQREAERGRKTEAELDEEIARVIKPMLRDE